MKTIKKLLSICVIMPLFISAITAATVVRQSLQRPEVSAQSAVVMDCDSGKVYFSKNGDEVRAIASLTKVMTTILTLEAGDPDSMFPADNAAIHVEGTSMGLREGDIVTRRALCYGMMLPSGNDAANAAAVSVAGNIPAFVELMNAKAREIGMNRTTFANPHGLDQSGHLSTAYDTALMTRYAMQNAEFREICASHSARVEFGNPPFNRGLNNNNKLLWTEKSEVVGECVGVKTGFTDNARRCLISAFSKGETDGTLIVVTLNAPDDWNDHLKLAEYGFELRGKLYNDYG